MQSCAEGACITGIDGGTWTSNMRQPGCKQDNGQSSRMVLLDTLPGRYQEVVPKISNL